MVLSPSYSPFLPPASPKRAQRWRKTKQLGEGARNSLSPFYRSEIDPRAHRRGVRDPSYCRAFYTPASFERGGRKRAEERGMAGGSCGFCGTRDHRWIRILFLSPNYSSRSLHGFGELWCFTVANVRSGRTKTTCVRLLLREKNIADSGAVK